LLARRSQHHQTTLVSHVNVWDPETAARLQAWADHFSRHGADAFTADRRALGTLYGEVTRQAQLLAFADIFWLLFAVFCLTLLLLPLLRRVHVEPPATRPAREAAPSALHVE
jgi:DHA2 family multidrug resistance protein